MNFSVLRQLRAGHEKRPEGFPQSVVRDIRDYRIRRRGDGEAGGSGRRQDGRGVVVWTL